MAVILVTRPDTKGAELVAQLKKLGHHAISFPYADSQSFPCEILHILL